MLCCLRSSEKKARKIQVSRISTVYWRIIDQHNDQFPVGLIAHLVEHCSCISTYSVVVPLRPFFLYCSSSKVIKAEIKRFLFWASVNWNVHFFFSVPFSVLTSQSTRGLLWPLRVRSFAFYANVCRPRFWAFPFWPQLFKRRRRLSNIQLIVLGTGCEVFLWEIILRKSAF